MNSPFRAQEGTIIERSEDVAYVHAPSLPHAAEPAMRREGISYGEALRSIGPKYAPHNANAPILGGLDIAGLIAATVITLGPLAAYSFGFGA